MTTLHDIMDVQLLGEHLANGFVSMRHHPQFPQLYILNYTAKTQYEDMWDEVTKQCRGMVVDNDTDEIVARPLQKFYNYGDDQHIDFSLDGPIEVTEKMDGSMITVSRWNDEIIVASRGSFESDHAGWAKELLGDFNPYRDLTYVFELIHPENRIVVDYGDRKELVLLTIVDNETGLDDLKNNEGIKNLDVFDLSKHAWYGPTVKIYDFKTIDEVLASPEVKNMEGFVVKFKYRDEQRLKIKFAEYVKLHKIMTNFSELAIWEVLSTGGSLHDWLTNVPDEFYNQVMETVETLNGQYDQLMNEVNTQFALLEHLKDDRKSFAKAASIYTIKSALFAKLDGKTVEPWIWKQIRPRGDKVETKCALQRGTVYASDASLPETMFRTKDFAIDDEPLKKVQSQKIEDSDEW